MSRRRQYTTDGSLVQELRPVRHPLSPQLKPTHYFTHVSVFFWTHFSRHRLALLNVSIKEMTGKTSHFSLFRNYKLSLQFDMNRVTIQKIYGISTLQNKFAVSKFLSNPNLVGIGLTKSKIQKQKEWTIMVLRVPEQAESMTVSRHRILKRLQSEQANQVRDSKYLIFLISQVTWYGARMKTVRLKPS